MSWICFHIENERLLKAAVSEEIRVECDKLFRQRGYEVKCYNKVVTEVANKI